MRDRAAVKSARWVGLLAGIVVAGAAAGATVLYLAETGGAFDSHAQTMVLAAVAIALTGLFTVPTSSGNRLTPAYIAVAALPLVAPRLPADVGTPVGTEAYFDFHSALASVLAGLAVLAVLRAIRRHDGGAVVEDLVRRLIVFVSYLYAYDRLDATAFIEGSEWRRVAMFALAGLVAFAVEVVVHVVFTGGLFRGRTRHHVTSGVSDAAVFVSLLTTGALFGLSYETIGQWAFAVAVLPYAFTAGAFRRLSQTKGTYEQTLVALAQIPEVGGHTPIGHAARTNDLATAVAERIGVSPKDYERINYASFLHDIGRITLNEPSILRQGFTDVDLAGWGAEIVGETKYLEDVATIVRRQHEPFRSPGEVSNPDLPLASRIIKVCSAYDESIHEMGFSPLEALERIHRGTVYDFDPDVVRELREVLERRGMLNHPATVTPG